MPLLIRLTVQERIWQEVVAVLHMASCPCHTGRG